VNLKKRDRTHKRQKESKLKKNLTNMERSTQKGGLMGVEKKEAGEKVILRKTSRWERKRKKRNSKECTSKEEKKWQIEKEGVEEKDSSHGATKEEYSGR